MPILVCIPIIWVPFRVCKTLLHYEQRFDNNEILDSDEMNDQKPQELRTRLRPKGALTYAG